jgi:hypothetical protein
VRAAQRFRDDLVHQTEALEIGGGDLHGRGRLFRASGVAPEDGRAPFGSDDGIDRVLQHVHAVADGHGQRAPAAALARHVHDDRRGQAGHLAQVVGDGLRLATLLRVQAGIGARRVHEGDDRAAELGRELHDPERLAVALRLRHPEVPVDLLLGVAALLMSDHGHRAVLVAGEARDQGRIVTEAPVAVQLREVREQRADVVERVRAIGMTGHLCLLPGGEPGVDGAPLLAQLLAQAPGLLLLDRVSREGGELLDALLQRQERRLEVIRHGS